MSIPNELLEKILKRLTISQLIEYRLVCKRWYCLIQKLKLKEIILYFQSFPFCSQYPTHDKPIKFRNSLALSNDFGLIRSIFIQNLFANLETLFLFQFSRSNETEEKVMPIRLLESFKKLRFLTLVDIHVLKEKNGSNILSLPNLEVLVLWISVNLSNIVLDAPKLTQIKTNNCSNCFQLKMPGTIKFLLCDFYDSPIDNLSNLEYLFIELVDDVDNNFLRANKWVKLKELHVSEDRETFQSLISQKHIYKRTNLRLFYAGIEYKTESASSFDRLISKSTLDKENVQVYYKNYHHLKQNYFINTIKYNEVISCFGKMPYDFLDKFKLIYIVEVKGKIKNQFEFMNFIKKCKTLTTINFSNNSLEQKYYDILPEICPFLIQLYIQESRYEINYQFILKLKNLLQFTTNQNIDLKLANQVLSTCEQLDCFSFLYKKTEVLIEKAHPKFNMAVIFSTGKRKNRVIKEKKDIIKALSEMV